MTEATLFEGALVKSVSIDNMLNQRQAVIERVRAGLDVLHEARTIAGTAGIGFPRLKIDEGRYSCYDMLSDTRHEVDKTFVRCIDAAGWHHLMNESGMRSLMDAKARKEWDESIQKGEFPEFNRANIDATFRDLHGSRGDIFERGVLAVFKSLAWDYKTNRPFAFGKRIIVTYIRDSISGGKPGSTTLGYPNHRTCEHLDDLVRVFSVLDGKPEPDHRHGIYHAMSPNTALPGTDVETEYMTIRSYRNGNGHILFKRPELVEKMNAILAKHFPGALAHDHHVAV